MAEAPLTVPDTWNPRWERHFERTWLTHLVMHAGQWCHASDVWQPCDAYQRTLLRQRAHEAVLAARRLGVLIESDRRLGYRVVGHDDLPKYLFPERRSDEPAAGAPGQLSLVADGE